jgi:uncharacterized membrane protein YkgB
VAKLFKAGDHVPEMELVEVVGNADKVVPEQIGVTAVNVGVTAAATFKVTVSVITTPQVFVADNVKTTAPVTPAPTV